jgi:hypothetical protein
MAISGRFPLAAIHLPHPTPTVGQETPLFPWNKKPRKYGSLWPVCARRHLGVPIRQPLPFRKFSLPRLYESIQTC